MSYTSPNIKTIQKTIYITVILLFWASQLYPQKNTFKTLEYKDLPYLSEDLITNDSLQRLNLVIPDRKDKTPLLIWIGGGAWSYGDRNQEMDLAQKFATNGIAVASIGHRLSPAIWRDSTLSRGIQHPKHVEDIALSVKWLYDHADEYGYSQEHFFVGGFSSGGHLAALIALDSSYLNEVGLSSKIFKGIVPISGTYDIVNYHEVFKNRANPQLAELHVEAVFGNTIEDFKQASPVSYLDNLSAPMLLMSDNMVDRYTRRFERSIAATGFKDIETIYAEDLAHAALWRDLSFSEKSRYRDIILNFINAQLAKRF